MARSLFPRSLAIEAQRGQSVSKKWSLDLGLRADPTKPADCSAALAAERPRNVHGHAKASRKSAKSSNSRRSSYADAGVAQPYLQRLGQLEVGAKVGRHRQMLGH